MKRITRPGIKKTLIRILVVLLTCPAIAGAQKFEVGFTTGYSFFRMNSMSENLQATMDTLPFKAEIVADFPSRISLGGYFSTMFKSGYSFGVAYCFNSTGGKISYADYSGIYAFNETLTSHALGITNG